MSICVLLYQHKKTKYLYTMGPVGFEPFCKVGPVTIYHTLDPFNLLLCLYRINKGYIGKIILLSRLIS